MNGRADGEWPAGLQNRGVSRLFETLANTDLRQVLTALSN
jgi:hypothetical protein